MHTSGTTFFSDMLEFGESPSMSRSSRVVCDATAWLAVFPERSHNAQSALERESEASARRIGKEVQSVSLETPKDNNNNSTKVRALSYYTA